mmetsp:Transcript_11109/g.21450  ORF Transcript_11109/g.21450 Transcript_11109/m.21450 type:complete len:90 (-) Transcript_11109:1244-1513(-)
MQVWLSVCLREEDALKKQRTSIEDSTSSQNFKWCPKAAAIEWDGTEYTARPTNACLNVESPQRLDLQSLDWSRLSVNVSQGKRKSPPSA